MVFASFACTPILPRYLRFKPVLIPKACSTTKRTAIQATAIITLGKGSGRGTRVVNSHATKPIIATVTISSIIFKLLFSNSYRTIIYLFHYIKNSPKRSCNEYRLDVVTFWFSSPASVAVLDGHTRHLDSDQQHSHMLVFIHADRSYFGGHRA